MQNKLFNGLIAYYGGKQKLAKEIIRLAKKYSDSDTFVDCFCGGLSVSLVAKFYNYNVLSNDRAFYSYQLAKAIIENQNYTLSEYDVYKILLYDDKKINYAIFNGLRETLRKHFILQQHIDFILKASYINNYLNEFKNEFKKALINALIIKYTISLAPYSMFRSNVEQIKNTTKYSTLRIISKQLITSIEEALKNVQKINNSIFATNKITKAYNMDVFDFLEEVKPKNCVVYLDPPYYGEHSYEEIYNLLNRILLVKTLETSVFNEQDYEKFFSKLLDKVKDNLVIISYAGKAIEKIVDITKKFFKNVFVHAYDYDYCLSAYKGNKIQKTKEYLIICNES